MQEPRQSPSHATTTTGSMSFDLPQHLEAAAEPSAGTARPCSSSGAQQQQQEEEQEDQELHQQTASQMTAPNAVGPGAAAAAGQGSTTPGDGLGMMLHGGPDLEETTTPELEQIGIVPSQEGGSQQQHLLGSAPGAAAAAAAGGFGSRAHVASAGRGRGDGSSGGRGSRGPGVVCEEVTTKQMLFPVFRPLKERKCVILVRHGESSEWLVTHCQGWLEAFGWVLFCLVSVCCWLLVCCRVSVHTTAGKQCVWVDVGTPGLPTTLFCSLLGDS